jgi:hypothetical protein
MYLRVGMHDAKTLYLTVVFEALPPREEQGLRGIACCMPTQATLDLTGNLHCSGQDSTRPRRQVPEKLDLRVMLRGKCLA